MPMCVCMYVCMYGHVCMLVCCCLYISLLLFLFLLVLAPPSPLPPPVTFIGPVHTCPYAGLASLVPANNNLKVPLTYGQAKDICEQSGMVLRNDFDPWTRSCSHSLSQSVKNTYKVEVFEINNPWRRAARNLLAAKRGVICTILNYCKCYCPGKPMYGSQIESPAVPLYLAGSLPRP